MHNLAFHCSPDLISVTVKTWIREELPGNFTYEQQHTFVSVHLPRGPLCCWTALIESYCSGTNLLGVSRLLCAGSLTLWPRCIAGRHTQLSGAKLTIVNAQITYINPPLTHSAILMLHRPAPNPIVLTTISRSVLSHNMDRPYSAAEVAELDRICA